MNSNTYHTLPVLLAEDDECDVMLMQRAFQAAGMSNPLKVVRNGQEAIWYLEAKGRYADRREYPWPGLLLLDLKMPLMNGWDVLRWLQEPGNRKGLPVVVFSGSNNDTDAARALDLGADAYRVKPFEFGGLVQLVEQLRACWLAAEPAAARETSAG
jgi:CheY-like chemotaxis protein